MEGPDRDLEATYFHAHRVPPIAIDPPDPNAPPPQVVPESEWPVAWRTIIGPPRRQRPGGAFYYPIQREDYEPGGATTWSATGLVLDPWNPGADPGSGPSLASLTFTFYQRDDQGRALYTVMDAQPGGGGAPPVRTSAPTPAHTTPVGPPLPRMWPMASIPSTKQPTPTTLIPIRAGSTWCSPPAPTTAAA